MLQQVSHILVMLSVLLSTSGFVVQRHYCQNTLKHTTLFVSSPSCHEEATDKASCPMHQPGHGESQDQGNCCNDESELVKLDQQVVVTPELIVQPVFMAIMAIVWPALVTFPAPDTDRETYLSYKPPPLVCLDIPVSLQTFRC